MALPSQLLRSRNLHYAARDSRIDFWRYTESDSRIGIWQGGALKSGQAKPTPKQPNLKKLGDTGGSDFNDYPTTPETILESRAVYPETLQQTLRDALSAILTGEKEPKYIIQYPDTPQNRLALIAEICRFYSIFLLDEMHRETMYDILQSQGMWIQKRHSYDPIPTFAQIQRFSEALENTLRKIILEPIGKKVWVHLGYDYGPNSAPLEFAFREAGLNNDFYYLLPYKSLTHIHIDQGVIDLNLNLAGPPF